MNFTISKTKLADILELRSTFLRENNFQIRYNSVHERGWSDSYLITSNGALVGYGAVMGKEDFHDRDTIFEFYIIPSFRKNDAELFDQLVSSSGASYIECQTNEPLLNSFMQKFGKNIETTAILFGAGVDADLKVEGGIFRSRKDDDSIFEHKGEPVGDYVLEFDKIIVATGGFFLHYNFPFADIYMEVSEDHRRKGFGSYLVQEIKKQCYLKGRVPAARCDPGNKASKATLLKAGMKIAGEMLIGSI